MKFKKGTLVRVVKESPSHQWSKEMLSNLYIVREMWPSNEGNGKWVEWYGLDFAFDIYNTWAYGWQLEEVKIGIKDITYSF